MVHARVSRLQEQCRLKSYFGISALLVHERGAGCTGRGVQMHTVYAPLTNVRMCASTCAMLSQFHFVWKFGNLQVRSCFWTSH